LGRYNGDVNRRQALIALGGFGAGLLGAFGVGRFAVDRPVTGALSSEPPPRVVLATVAEVMARGKTVELPGRDPVIVVPVGAGLAGYSAVCTHASCSVGYDPQQAQIVCPCHGSRFDPATGRATKGPARDPLAPVAVTIDGDRVIFKPA
jgi:Rieske Fe-S protein